MKNTSRKKTQKAQTASVEVPAHLVQLIARVVEEIQSLEATESYKKFIDTPTYYLTIDRQQPYPKDRNAWEASGREYQEAVRNSRQQIGRHRAKNKADY